MRSPLNAAGRVPAFVPNRMRKLPRANSATVLAPLLAAMLSLPTWAAVPQPENATYLDVEGRRLVELKSAPGG